MGLNIGSLTKVLFGVGVGILIVSCLAVTICFGRCASSFTKAEKIWMKVSFDYTSSVYSSSIAIAVLGCLAFATALATLVLTLIIEDQTVILIIVGGASAVFTFGCIIAEGLFTQYSYKNGAHDYYKEDDLSHKSAQKYIKKAIKEIYQNGMSLFLSKNKDLKIMEWSQFEKKLGTVDDNKNLITYATIWNEEDSSADYITLTKRQPYIIANFKGQRVYVGYTTFTLNKSYTPKKRLCWYNSDKTKFDCKSFDMEKVDINEEYDITYSFNTLNEKIVEGKYISNEEATKQKIYVDYQVSEFPVAYKKLNSDDNQRIEKGEHISISDSTNKFRVSGKQFLEYRYESSKEVEKRLNEKYYTMALYKPSSYSDYEEKCKEATTTDKEEYYICRDRSIYYSEIASVCIRNSKDYNKGVVPSFIKKHYYSEARKEFNDNFVYPNCLYSFALINLIIQIFGILLWACGRFLGLILEGGNKDEKTASEGEA